MEEHGGGFGSMSQTGKVPPLHKIKNIERKTKPFLSTAFILLLRSVKAKYSELFDKLGSMEYNISATGSDSRGYAPNGA